MTRSAKAPTKKVTVIDVDRCIREVKLMVADGQCCLRDISKMTGIPNSSLHAAVNKTRPLSEERWQKVFEAVREIAKNQA